MLLPAGLIVWARQERSMTGRTLVVLGLGLSALALLGLQVWSARIESTPLASMIAQSVAGEFQGDRIAAWVALIPALMALWSARSVIEGEAPRYARFLAMVFSLSLVGILGVVALHVSQELLGILDPLKRVLLLGAGLVITPVALGCLISEVVAATRRGVDAD